MPRRRLRYLRYFFLTIFCPQRSRTNVNVCQTHTRPEKVSSFFSAHLYLSDAMARECRADQSNSPRWFGHLKCSSLLPPVLSRVKLPLDHAVSWQVKSHKPPPRALDTRCQPKQPNHLGIGTRGSSSWTSLVAKFVELDLMKLIISPADGDIRRDTAIMLRVIECKARRKYRHIHFETGLLVFRAVTSFWVPDGMFDF
jgi:hypothetical protein